MTALYDANDFLHPLDLAARQQLENIPLLQAAVKKYRAMVADRRERHFLLSSAVRLGPRQLPEVYRLLPPICTAFGIPEPELFVTRGGANAMAFGDNRTCIVLTDELLADLPEDEIRAVLAHECGHILAQHVLYRQMAIAVLGAGGTAGSFGGKIGAAAQLLSMPLQVAMLNWFRKSELTADRAAATYLGSADPMQRAIFHLVGVPKWWSGEVSYEEFGAQAEEFDLLSVSSKWDQWLTRELEKGSTHPIPAIRVRELGTWSGSETFRQLRAIAEGLPGGASSVSCPQCGMTVEPGWAFCQRCGTRMSDGSRVTAGTTRGDVS